MYVSLKELNDVTKTAWGQTDQGLLKIMLNPKKNISGANVIVFLKFGEAFSQGVFMIPDGTY